MPAAATVGGAYIVTVTSSTLGAQPPLVIVHLNVLVEPIVKLVTDVL